MEFFLGAFERDWERRRAARLHELERGDHDELDWSRRAKGRVARPLEEAAEVRPRSGARSSLPGTFGLRGKVADRPMLVRFTALANGSQPAVVKLASYGGGTRVAAMMSYISRGGELPVENDRGERVLGKTALADQRSDWEHLFANRTASRDVGMFEVTIDDVIFTHLSERNEVARKVLRAGFGDRRLVFAVEEKGGRELEIRGVVVLRDCAGERLSADARAAALVQKRFETSHVGRGAEVHFRFHGYGNGVEFATARVRELLESAKGHVEDGAGRAIKTSGEVGDLVQKQWRRELHSRKGRDVMHLVISARAETNASAFRAAARDFLGEQFNGSRYLFALHDPALDPKEVGQGGKRPHIHAHAIVTMLSETGQRIETSPQTFRQWRELMAQKAREHGIDMELTDRRDRASSPAYYRNQVRPTGYLGRTEHQGTSLAARARYKAKRQDRPHIARSRASLDYANTAVRTWNEVARFSQDPVTQEVAVRVGGRLQMAIRECQKSIDYLRKISLYSEFNANMVEFSKLVPGADAMPMRAMTRPEFELYERRVETLLAKIGASIKSVERRDFDEIAAVARRVVSLRREYLQLTERQSAEPNGSRNELPLEPGVDKGIRLTPDGREYDIPGDAPNASEARRNPVSVSQLELNYATERRRPDAEQPAVARRDKPHGRPRRDARDDVADIRGHGRDDEREH